MIAVGCSEAYGDAFRRHLAVASAVLLAVSLPRALASNGVELTGISFQARARGGADVAVGDSALSQIDNPATLTLTLRGRPRFDFAGQFVFPSVSWNNPFGSYQSGIRVIPIGDAAVAFPVNERFTWGLAVHAKSGLATRFHARHLLIPLQERRVGSDCKNVGLYLNGAYRLTDKLSLGAGLRGELLTSEFSAVLGPADVEFGRGYAYGLGFQLGMHYQATETLALGIAYRSPTWADDVRGGQAKTMAEGHARRATEAMDDMERMNEVMMGREERVLEVKQEVNDLLAQLGQARKYEHT